VLPAHLVSQSPVYDSGSATEKEEIPQGWNDDALVPESCEAVANEAVCLDDSVLPPTQVKQARCFTWTSTEAPPSSRAADKHSNKRRRDQAALGGVGGLAWSSAPMPDPIHPNSQSLASDWQENGIGNSDLSRGSMAFPLIDAQAIGEQQGVQNMKPEDKCEDLKNETTNGMLSRPIQYSNAAELGNETQRNSLSHQARAENSVEELLLKSSTFGCGPRLLESVCKLWWKNSCLSSDGSHCEVAFAKTIGGESLEADRTPLDDDFWAEASSSAQVIENLFFESVPRQHVVIHSIEVVLDLAAAKRFVERVEDDGASVGVTFHAARPEDVGRIRREGSLTKDFGSQVWAHAGTAHLHADQDQKGRRFLCVLLTAVREDLRAQVSGEKRSHGAPLGEDFQARVEERALVSHLISYSVHGGGRKRVGGGFDDPFQRRLSSAVQQAGSRQRSSSGRPRPHRGRQALSPRQPIG